MDIDCKYRSINTINIYIYILDRKRPKNRIRAKPLVDHPFESANTTSRSTPIARYPAFVLRRLPTIWSVMLSFTQTIRSASTTMTLRWSCSKRPSIIQVIVGRAWRRMYMRYLWCSQSLYILYTQVYKGILKRIYIFFLFYSRCSTDLFASGPW